MKFQLFNRSHLSMIILMLIGILTIFFFANVFPNAKDIFRIFLIIQLIFHIFYHYLGHFFLKSFVFPEHLQFHLCSVSIYLSLFSLILNQEILHQTVYLWGLAGALGAIIFPDLVGQKDFPSFTFNEFFVSHTGIVWTIFWLIAFENLELPYLQIWVVYGLLGIYSGLMYLLNLAWNANFLYLRFVPKEGPLAALPKPPLHIFALAGIILAIFHLQFLLLFPFR